MDSAQRNPDGLVRATDWIRTKKKYRCIRSMIPTFPSHQFVPRCEWYSWITESDHQSRPLHFIDLIKDDYCQPGCPMWSIYFDGQRVGCLFVGRLDMFMDRTTRALGTKPLVFAWWNKAIPSICVDLSVTVYSSFMHDLAQYELYMYSEQSK